MTKYINDKEFGRVEVTDIPLPAGVVGDVTGTYTYSGRVLVAVALPDKGKDFYRVFTMEDDGTDIAEVLEGEFPQSPTANGIRWMCAPDNKRVYTGDYVIEASPDLDHPEHAEVVPVHYPEAVYKLPGLFKHWSENIIAPDNEHVVWTSLQAAGAVNYMGRLVRYNSPDRYVIEDAGIISAMESFAPDPEHEGCTIPCVPRGGEAKQFVRGGLALSLAGGGSSLSNSNLQALDSEDFRQITDTPGYDETVIFSPDEKLGVAMSARFSPATDCGILGLIPDPVQSPVRGSYTNMVYQFAVSGVRNKRPGNIGPALIDIDKSMSLGRDYIGADLSDPEGKWVYVSPISWHPDSTRAMWIERTRTVAGPMQTRLRRAHLLDKEASKPVTGVRTPDAKDIPYALPLNAIATSPALPVIIHGKCGGTVTSDKMPSGAMQTTYEHFNNDGETTYDGYLRVMAPASMFSPGETVIESHIDVTGMHNGKSRFTLVFEADNRLQVTVNRDKSEGYAEYDGVRRIIEEMAD